MSEAMCTPGPWEIIDGSYGCKNIHRIGTYPDGGIFAIQAIGYTHGLSDESEDAANAKLIAAAPDLLEALKCVLSGISRIPDDVLDVITNAIQKATQ